MSFVQIDVVGRDRIERDLALFPAKAQRVYARAVTEAAAVYRDHTKKLPPVSAARTGYAAVGIPVDTGRLRQSVQSRKLSPLAAEVGPRVKYSGYVHDGTSRMPARPFMDWSLESGGMAKIDAVFERASRLLP